MVPKLASRKIVRNHKQVKWRWTDICRNSMQKPNIFAEASRYIKKVEKRVIIMNAFTGVRRNNESPK